MFPTQRVGPLFLHIGSLNIMDRQSTTKVWQTTRTCLTLFMMIVFFCRQASASGVSRTSRLLVLEKYSDRLSTFTNRVLTIPAHSSTFNFRGGNGTRGTLAFVQPSSSLSFFHSSSRVEGRPKTSKTKRKRPKLDAKTKKKRAREKEFFRADRVLAQRSQRPRSECFDLLKQKRVWSRPEYLNHCGEVNGRDNRNNHDTAATSDDWIAISGPSAKLTMNTPLWIDRTHAVPLPPPLVMAYHKPKWVLSVTSDPHLNRPCLDETIVPAGMHPVGRLDYDSSGLLLFSSSGALTQRLLHPKHEIPKEYRVVVTNVVDREKLEEQFTAGVKTGEGIHTAELLSVEPWSDENVAPYLATVSAALPHHYNQTDLEERGYLDVFQATALTTVTVRVREGKHRMVRRIMANCGHPVVTLVRQKFGEISLDDLPERKSRAVTRDEEAWLQSILNDKIK